MALLSTTPLAANGGSSGRTWARGSSPANILGTFCIKPFVFVLALLFVGIPIASAQTEVSREYQIKAGFLFNFPQFVDWPQQAFSSPQSPFVIGVLGSDPFGTFLDRLVDGATANDRPLIVRRFSRVDEITTCHILFISRSEAPRFKSIFDTLKGRNILTVGDVESFGREGGMVRFLTENTSTRLRINVDAVKSAELAINSKLLRRAEIVHDAASDP